MRRTRCVCNSCFHGDPLRFPNTQLTCKNSSKTLFYLSKRTWMVNKTALRGCSEEEGGGSSGQPAGLCKVARPLTKESTENWAKFSHRTSGVAHMSYLCSSVLIQTCKRVRRSPKKDQLLYNAIASPKSEFRVKSTKILSVLSLKTSVKL